MRSRHLALDCVALDINPLAACHRAPATTLVCGASVLTSSESLMQTSVPTLRANTEIRLGRLGLRGPCA
jgi:hypothetical protein